MSEEQKKLPAWMNTQDEYEPYQDHASGLIRIVSIASFFAAKMHIAVRRKTPDTMSPSEGILACAALILFLCMQPYIIFGILLVFVVTGYIYRIRRTEWKRLLIPAAGAALAFLVCSLPQIFARPIDIVIYLYRVLKVFGSIEMAEVVLHTWTWTELTMAMGRIYIPSFLIFAFDLTGKYITCAGKMVFDMMQSLNMRYVGKSNQKYQTPGGLLGTGLLKSTAKTKQMYQAMICRGYTPDYKEHK